jgi:hypothetical protein
MKYNNNLMKGSQDIERTSFGLPTDMPTGAKQFASPLRRGHNKTKPKPKPKKKQKPKIKQPT